MFLYVKPYAEIMAHACYHGIGVDAYDNYEF